MRTIINYTTFKTNDEFVQWQTDGIKKNIHTVQPQMMDIGIDMDESGEEGSKNVKGQGAPSFGVFVTYLIEIKEDEDGTTD